MCRLCRLHVVPTAAVPFDAHVHRYNLTTTRRLAASTSSMLSAAVEGKEGANREGDDDHDDDDSSIIIAMVEGDFQQALLASYQTFAAQETARCVVNVSVRCMEGHAGRMCAPSSTVSTLYGFGSTANEAGAVLALPTVVSPDQQPPTNHKGAAALGGLGPVGQAPSSSFSFGQTPPPPLYHQSFSYLPAPVRRRGSLLEQRGQQVCHCFECVPRLPGTTSTDQ